MTNAEIPKKSILNLLLQIPADDATLSRQAARLSSGNLTIIGAIRPTLARLIDTNNIDAFKQFLPTIQDKGILEFIRSSFEHETVKAQIPSHFMQALTQELARLKTADTLA